MNTYIKMVGLDLDGTLLTSEKKLTDYTKNVLKQAIDQGCVVLVSTGRPLSAIPEELLRFPGMKYAVTANGARIVDTESGDTLYENLVSVEKAVEVLDILEEYDNMFDIFIDGQGYTAADCMEHIWDYFPDPSMQRYILTTRIPVQNVKETLLLHNRPVDKVHGVFRNPEEKEKARQRVRTISEIEVTGAFFHNLEVNAKGVTKGQALLRLGEMLGIKREEIMAYGDGMNDYEMLSAVGFGVAMGNAMEPLKEIADYITETNDENGVAKAIEKFVLRREGE